MESCASTRDWAREIAALGHEVRLIAPIYVKFFVKRQKNGAADAEAIVEPASRPTMRFVTVKSLEKRAAAMMFKMRDLLVRQRTQAINALRGRRSDDQPLMKDLLHQPLKPWSWLISLRPKMPASMT